MEANDFSPLIFYMSMLQWAKFEVLITSLGEGGGGGGVGGGVIWKIIKGGGSIVQWQVFLNVRGVG